MPSFFIDELEDGKSELMNIILHHDDEYFTDPEYAAVDKLIAAMYDP